MSREVVPIRPMAPVTWHCGCQQCACIAEVVKAGAMCHNCSTGNHH